MHSTHQLLDAAKARAGLQSDYKLGIALGLTSDSAVTHYRKGRSHPDDKTGRRLADLAGLDEGYVLACLHAERAKDEDSRQAWQRIAKRLEGIAAALLLAVLANLFGVTFDQGAMAKTPAPSPASQQAPHASGCGSVYYVNRLIQRVRQYFGRFFGLFTSPGLASI